MVSPTNSRRIGCVGAGRVEVDNAAAHAELAGFVDRILARVAGLREELRERRRRDVLARRQHLRGAHQPIGLRQPWQEVPQPTRRRVARSRRRSRAGPARVPTRCRSAVSSRGRDRLRATETAAPRARHPHPTIPRARPGRSARRPSCVRRRHRWRRRAASARGRPQPRHSCAFAGEVRPETPTRVGSHTGAPRGRLEDRAKRQRAGCIGGHSCSEREPSILPQSPEERLSSRLTGVVEEAYSPVAVLSRTVVGRQSAVGGRSAQSPTDD